MTVGAEAFFEPIKWTAELEQARIKLCEFWLSIADDPSEGACRYPELGRRAIETEQALTILGEIARDADLIAAAVNSYHSAQQRIAELEEALKRAAEQLTRAHTDAFSQCSGYGLVTSDGHDFSCFQLNQCSEGYPIFRVESSPERTRPQIPLKG
jgi:hypothetical protein